MSEQQRIDRLEERVEDGFATARSEARADFRLLLAALMVLIFAVMSLGFVAIIAAGS
jgi:hypothetical protein